MIPLVLTEKYRPKSLIDMVLPNITRTTVINLLQTPLEMPHLLFVSTSPGVGKSTLARVIVNETSCDEFDVLIVNSSDDRKLEMIRDKIKNFALTERQNKNVPRFIIMDEFDGMRSESQDALRFIMERYASNCKFILTANELHKIIEPISSRCQVISIDSLPKEQILARLVFIMGNENLKYSTEELESIIDLYYPDMRSMINAMQTGVKTQPKELYKQFYGLLKTGSLYDIRKFAITNSLDAEQLLTSVLTEVMNDTTLISGGYTDRVRDFSWHLAEIAFRMRMSASKDIQLVALAAKFKDIWGL